MGKNQIPINKPKERPLNLNDIQIQKTLVQTRLQDCANQVVQLTSVYEAYIRQILPKPKSKD